LHLCEKNVGLLGSKRSSRQAEDQKSEFFHEEILFFE
jgi:hypothetical protein